METFLDPEYKYHQAIARSFAEMARILSESVVLPLDLRPYASDLNGMWLNLKNTSQARSIEERGISLGKVVPKTSNGETPPQKTRQNKFHPSN